jgi:hypothetical protein
MTLPPNIRVNAQFPFPATVQGTGPVIISKSGGIWNISLNYAQISPLPIGFDPTSKLLLIFDQISNSFVQTTLSSLLATVAAGILRIVTAAGDVTVTTTDSFILMNKSVGAATNINLPSSASRAGLALHIKDYKGDAATNNITFVPNGVETIDGFSGAAAAANGTAVINVNNGHKILYPLPSGGWFI